MSRAAILLAMATSGLAADYAVAPLLAPSGFVGVSMSGINNSGQVAGYGRIGNISQPFVGSTMGSALIPLPTGWTGGNAAAINASGQVAGTVSEANSSAAFIGSPSGSTLIPLPSGLLARRFASYGYALNDSGQVVGTILGVNSVSPAFIGTTSESVLLLSPSPGGGPPAAQPNGINNSGQVAGAIVNSYFLSGSAGNVTTYQEFIGTTAGVAMVPAPPGWESANPWAINASGQVAGVVSTRCIMCLLEQAFIGTVAGSTLIPLPAAASQSSVGGQSINDLGIVVGQSNSGGWIWDAANGTRLLNTLVPKGWNVTNGISISNNGLILAQASYQGGASQYVELIPAGIPGTPAPSTLALVLVGAMFCGICLRFVRFRQKAA